MMIEIIGDLTKKEQKEVRKIITETHEKMKKYPVKRVIFKTHHEGRNFFYKVRGFTDKEVVIGINSNTFTSSREKHILMCDFDLNRQITLPQIKEMLSKVQEDEGLPNVHLYRSSGKGIFALCFTELSWEELIRIESKIEYQDEQHKFFMLKNKFLTLRATEKADKPSKIEFLETIESKNPRRGEIMGAKRLFEKLVSGNKNDS